MACCHQMTFCLHSISLIVACMYRNSSFFRLAHEEGWREKYNIFIGSGSKCVVILLTIFQLEPHFSLYFLLTSSLH